MHSTEAVLLALHDFRSALQPTVQLRGGLWWTRWKIEDKLFKWPWKKTSALDSPQTFSYLWLMVTTRLVNYCHYVVATLKTTRGQAFPFPSSPLLPSLPFYVLPSHSTFFPLHLPWEPYPIHPDTWHWAALYAPSAEPGRQNIFVTLWAKLATLSQCLIDSNWPLIPEISLLIFISLWLVPIASASRRRWAQAENFAEVENWKQSGTGIAKRSCALECRWLVWT